jgi:quercetin dioxygenase-like cupin family protein
MELFMGIRRVITGHDETGKAVVISDEEASNIVQPAHRPGVAIHNLWCVDSAPAKIFGPEDTTKETIGLLPPDNGSVFRIIEFPPEKAWIHNIDESAAKNAWASIGAEHVGVTSGKPAHPLMHRTETVDFALCLGGEIHMVLDESEVLIKEGDVVIQRGTNHAWSNRTNAICKMMFVLIDGTFKEKQK